MPMTTQLKGKPLDIAELDVAKVKEDLSLVDPKNIKAEESEDPELVKKAAEYAELLTNFGDQDFDAQENSKAMAESVGLKAQRESANKSKMLQEPIRKLSQKGADGGEVANALVDLKLQVEELDPNKLNFEPGWFSRTVGLIPGMGKPLKRYFTKYESAQTVIDCIIGSLQSGQQQLIRDNDILRFDQIEMRKLTHRLEKAIKLGQLLDRKLEEKLSGVDAEDKSKFIQEELLFPLRQRVIDLQQQLAVNQQGILAVEIVIRNNKELIRGVDRALDVTVSALQVAVTVALALVNQKIVLNKIAALNVTTSSLIRETAARLKTQGVDIHKQASSAMLDMEALKSAFGDLRAAIEDISNYRVQALTQMNDTIKELYLMTEQNEEVIKKMERGNKARPSVSIEVE